MERRRCAACEQGFRPRAQAPGQLYCGQAACQRERRRRWQRSKRQRDEDYRANQVRAQRVWAADHSDYWRGWRAAHPEYTERNRVAQRRRDGERQGDQVTCCRLHAEAAPWRGAGGGVEPHDLGRRDNEKDSGEAHSPGPMVRRQVGNVPAGWMEDTLKRPTVAGGARSAG